MNPPARRGRSLVARRGALAASIAATCALATTAAAAPKSASTALSAAPTSAECGTVATAPVFARWGDDALYAPALGGDMEPISQPHWLLWPGAGFVVDNESFYLRARTDRYSLRLPAGTFANAPWLCVGADFPSARFMVRNTGAATGRLRVDVQYIASDLSTVGNVHLADVAATSKWAPSPAIALTLPAGVTTYRINFTAVGAGADFRMDDLFIDPMRRSL